MDMQPDHATRWRKRRVRRVSRRNFIAAKLNRHGESFIAPQRGSSPDIAAVGHHRDVPPRIAALTNASSTKPDRMKAARPAVSARSPPGPGGSTRRHAATSRRRFASMHASKARMGVIGLDRPVRGARARLTHGWATGSPRRSAAVSHGSSSSKPEGHMLVLLNSYYHGRTASGLGEHGGQRCGHVARIARASVAASWPPSIGATPNPPPPRTAGRPAINHASAGVSIPN